MDDGHERGRLSFRPRATTGEVGGRDEPLGLADMTGRDGHLYVPETAEAGAPVLVFLHGATGTGRSHSRAALAAADRYGVILVSPDSRAPMTWDLIATQGFGPDPAFFDRMLDAVADKVDADFSRLAIGGVSDGASYALSIGLSNGDLFPVVVAFSPGFIALAETNGKPRVYVSHGTHDPILPIDQCGRPLVRGMRREGYEVCFRVFEGGHTVPPEWADEGLRWWLTGVASVGADLGGVGGRSEL